MEYPLGNALTPYGTPLHTVELFLQLLKMTFADLPEGYPYKYYEDDFDKTGIAFDVALNKESDIYGKKPLVVVSRAMQSTQPIMIGDMAHYHIPTNFHQGSTIINSGLTIQIVSRNKAEVEIIAQIIYGLVTMCRVHLPGLLNIHMVNSMSMSEVTKMEDDDAIFIAQGMMQYVAQYKWSEVHDDPVLQSIGLTVLKMKDKYGSATQEMKDSKDKDNQIHVIR